MHTKTCQNYLWPVLRCTICHIKVPSRSGLRTSWGGVGGGGGGGWGYRGSVSGAGGRGGVGAGAPMPALSIPLCYQ